MFISKGRYGNGEPKKVNPESVQEAYRPVMGVQTTQFHAALYRAGITNLRKFGSTTNPVGSMFALKQCS